MGQRINIQYSVDIEDLAREAGRLLESAFIEYQSLQADCRLEPADVILSYEMAERLDKIRLTLASIDHRLNDVSHIIVGYLNYKAQESYGQPNVPVPSQATTVEHMEELGSKLEALKESIGTNKDEVSD